MSKQIVWKDLDKRIGLFTKRNTTMVDLKTGGSVQYYGSNTKINVVQETTLDGVRYFRTETAATQGLDWAFKASSFDLPTELASLEPSKVPLNDKTFSTLTHTNSPNKKVSKISETPKSEEVVSEERKHSLLSAFKRFFRRKK